MKWKQTITLLGILPLTSCISISHRDAVDDVRKEVTTRSSGAVVWSEEASLTDAPIDADRAVAIAFARSPSIDVILGELGVARADLIEASTVSNPIFGAEVRFPADPHHPFELSLTQSLLDLIQLSRRRALGRAGFDAAKNRATASLLAFAADVRDDYYAALAAREREEMARTIAAAGQAAVELALKQHEAGNITDLDLENEQASYEQAKLDLARSQEEAILRRESLIRRLGVRAPDGALQLAEDFPPLPAAEPTDQELDAAVAARRLDLAIARSEVESARRARPLAAFRSLGDVGVGVHHESEASGERSTGPSIDLPIPLFNRGRGSRERALAQLRVAEHRLAQLELSAESESRAARERLNAARARVEYYRDVIVPRRTRILALTTLEHNAMIAGFYQLMQAKQNEANARREYIEAQRDYWRARNDFDRTVNGVVVALDAEESAGSAAPSQRRGGH